MYVLMAYVNIMNVMGQIKKMDVMAGPGGSIRKQRV